MGSSYIAQACLDLLASSHPLTSVSQGAGITGQEVNLCAHKTGKGMSVITCPESEAMTPTVFLSPLSSLLLPSSPPLLPSLLPLPSSSLTFLFPLRWSFALVAQAGVQWHNLSSQQPPPSGFQDRDKGAGVSNEMPFSERRNLEMQSGYSCFAELWLAPPSLNIL
ncbi:hypothetical protein AAY473_005446, partial [Plecturocebus cupreus]